MPMRTYIALALYFGGVLCLATGCGGSGEPESVALAASHEPAPNPIYELNQALQRMRPETSSQKSDATTPVQINTVPESSEQATPAATDAAPLPIKSVADLADEVSSLRSDFQDLRDSVNETLDLVVADLHAENQRLRSELARRGATIVNSGIPGETPIATDYPQQPMQNTGITVAPADSTPPVTIKPVPVPPYETVRAWGRSPQEAKGTGPNTKSLRGMICVVTPSISDDQLVVLGRHIHAEFAEYDNLNIQVFDDVNAAAQKDEKNVDSVKHLVIKISKFRATGLDTILIMRNGLSRQVPL